MDRTTMKLIEHLTVTCRMGHNEPGFGAISESSDAISYILINVSIVTFSITDEIQKNNQTLILSYFVLFWQSGTKI